MAATKTAAKAPATRDAAIAAAAIAKAKAQRAVNTAREANPYTSYARDELVKEYIDATAELDRLVAAAIAEEEAAAGAA